MVWSALGYEKRQGGTLFRMCQARLSAGAASVIDAAFRADMT
jgi:hypothetical protein